MQETVNGNMGQHERSKAQTYSLTSLPEHVVERPENMMVGYEIEFEMMLDQLARGERGREVVSIVGMGGIGKTTLATKLYNDPCIMSRFGIRANVIVSQEYCVRNLLLDFLSSVSDEPDDQLANQLQKLLKGKRYLVVIDDIWTTGAWDDRRQCFSDCNNGSLILLTTRNVEVAGYASPGDEWEVAEEGFPRLKFMLLKLLHIRHTGEPAVITFPALNDYFLIVAGNWIQSLKILQI